VKGGLRLKSLGALGFGAAFTAGLAAAWLWLSAVQAWERHLTTSYVTGVSLFEALRTGTPLPAGLDGQVLSARDARLAEQGDFARLPGAPAPLYVTNASIYGPSPDIMSGERLKVAIVSGDLRYPVADITSAEGQSAAEKTGAITRLMAAYCSDAVLYLRHDDARWRRIAGADVWGCKAKPFDGRLLAAVLALIALGALFTLAAEIAAPFERFASALKTRRQLGGPDSYPSEGPTELREIVASVNSYLENERAHLSKRAVVLSGVSHDLGTPATRLRLRAALIADADLRRKLEADIDHMTGMIESALTYTRAELNVEEPRQLSLSSLVEALVHDYQDLGKPVDLLPMAPLVLKGGRSVFSSTSAQGSLPDHAPILLTARPIALQRALSNLIDNALKYGRRATVQILPGADSVTIAVEDEGTEMQVADIEAAIAPFKRGENASGTTGFGLGLTIVATIAEQHGGQLAFTNGARGLRAELQISRL
jgi:signal transduction histidine kinase